MPNAIIAIGIAVASIVGFLAIVGMPSIAYEKQDPVLSVERVCDEQENCSGIYTETTESKPKLVFKPIYEMSEQNEVVSEQNEVVEEDPSAKYYTEPPISHTCELTSNQNLRCTFEDGSAMVRVVDTSNVALVQSRLSYCNDIIQHRSASLDSKPMTRCLFDVQE